MPDALPEYGQCVHKVAVDAGDPDRMYAQNHFGVFRTDDAGRRWTSIAGGLPADFGFPIVASPRTPGTAWVIPLVADMQRVPPEGRLRVHRTRDAGETWTELGRRACPTAPGRRSCATRSAPTRATPPASTSAPATAASTPAPTRGTPSRSSPTTCPTSSPCARPGSRERAGGAARVAGRPGRRRQALDVDVGAAGDARRPARRAGAGASRCSAGGSATRPGQLRRFVNVYVDGEDVRFDGGLATAVRDGARRAGAAVGRRRVSGGRSGSQRAASSAHCGQSCWSS